jgi:hypothetical protein
MIDDRTNRDDVRVSVLNASRSGPSPASDRNRNAGPCAGGIFRKDPDRSIW